jgi:hypothetical protein
VVSRRRLVTLVAVVAALVAPTLAIGAPAGAQSDGTPTTAPAADAAPSIRLVRQDPWTPVAGDARLGFRVERAPAGASVSASVGQAITTRNQYDEAALDAPITSVLSQLSVPLELLPPDADGVRTVNLGLLSPTDARDPARLNVRRPGVYPLDIELRDADEQPVASFRTVLVVAEADRPTVAEPLRVAWVWPLTARPSFLAEGGTDKDVVAAFRPTGRLGRMALALQAHPDVPVTLAPTAETVEAWGAAAAEDPTVQATFEALVAAAATRTVLAGPYVPVDLPALLDHGLAPAADEVLTRGTDIMSGILGTPLDTRTRVLRPASPGALGRLRVAGADRAIVTAEALAPAPETRFTLAQPVTLTAPIAPLASDTVTALATDAGLQTFLTNAQLSPAQRVQLVLGGLALVALESPNVAHVVTLLDPDDFDPPAELYQGLLAGLRNNPYVRPVSTTEAFDTVPVDPPAVNANGEPGSSQRELASPSSVQPATSATEYRTARSRLNAFGALTHPGDPAVAVADRSLLASVSSAWSPDIADARAASHLQVVDRVIGDLVGRIEVPDPRTITLTSRSGEIPLTFRNDTGFPVRLRAALASDKLFFPDGSVIELDLPPKSTTVRVAVEARTSGTFPLDLEVTSTDGVLAISQRRLQVRSTYVSTVGWVLTASAVGFLALWWGIDLRRRRRRRRMPTTT